MGRLFYLEGQMTKVIRGQNMKVFDENFRSNKVRYIFQCLFATSSVFIILLFLDAITNVAVIAALGASSFIAFTMPEKQVSKPRFLIGGYLVGIAAGCLCHYLALVLMHLPVIQEFSYVVFYAISVGLAIFVMVITNTEHPPAASLALGLVLNFNYLTVVVVLVGIISLSIIKAALRPVLINLL
jgi:CBS-domain-containing membrane protein